MKLSKARAQKKLEARIAEFANARAYAEYVGVSEPLLSDMRRGNRYISGSVAVDLGIKRIVGEHAMYLEEAR